MTREEVKVEFTGLAHDHLMVNKQDVLHNSTKHHHQINNCSTTNECCGLSHKPEERQHKLIQNGDKSIPKEVDKQQQQDGDNLNKVDALSTIAILRRHPMYDSLVLVKRFRSCLDGYTLEFPTSQVDNQRNQEPQDCCKTKLVSVYLDDDDPIYQCQEKKNGKDGFIAHEGDVVYVPINGLLDRLENYDRHGVSIDSRVYAFAMGLKTAEKFLTSSSMKEIQETPPL